MADLNKTPRYIGMALLFMLTRQVIHHGHQSLLLYIFDIACGISSTDENSKTNYHNYENDDCLGL